MSWNSAVRPHQHVAASVGATGTLTLTVRGTDRRYELGPEHAAMWIAIQQHDGMLDTAAAELAHRWGLDVVQTRDRVRDWVLDLHAEGLVRITPASRRGG